MTWGSGRVGVAALRCGCAAVSPCSRRCEAMRDGLLIRARRDLNPRLAAPQAAALSILGHGPRDARSERVY